MFELRFGTTIILLIIVVGCESVPTIGSYVAPVRHSGGAMLSVGKMCEEGTPHCIITATFNPDHRVDDTYMFAIQESRCIKLANEKGEPLQKMSNQVSVFLEATLSRQFTTHIYPHPDSNLPTQCKVDVTVTGGRLESNGTLFFMKAHVVVHTHKNGVGKIVFGEDGTIPSYREMIQGASVTNMRCTFKDQVLYMGVGDQDVNEITVTLGEAMQFVPNTELVGVRQNNPQSVAITSAVLGRIPADGHKIVSFPVELVDDVVGAADTRCGDYPIKVSYPGGEPTRLPIKLVVSGCTGSTEDVLTFRAEPDRFNSPEQVVPNDDIDTTDRADL